MEVRKAFALVMILAGLMAAPFAVLGSFDDDWEFGDRWHDDWDGDWDHHWEFHD